MTPSDARWEGRTAAEWQARLAAPAVRVAPAPTSTNDVARDWAEAGAPAGALVIADTQSAGRGRSGRHWWSPPGVSLHASWVVRPPAPARGSADLGLLALRVGLALAEALEEAYGVATLLKWPNDVLGSSGRKLAGILCESALTRAAAAHVVVGVGVNLRRPGGPPPGLRGTAGSVAGELGRDVERSWILGPLCARMLALAAAPTDPLRADELARWRARDALAGRRVEVDGRDAGRALGIDASGALLVEDGARASRVYSGTVRACEAMPRRPWDATGEETR